MSVQELEAAVASLTREELTAFRDWFLGFDADAWDHQIEGDARAGRLDRLAKQADDHFEAGGCTPM